MGDHPRNFKHSKKGEGGPTSHTTHSGACPPAKPVPEGIEAFFPMIEDQNVKVRMYPVTALGGYTGLSDPLIEQTLRKALSDPKHKIRHLAARTLHISCPTCAAEPVA